MCVRVCVYFIRIPIATAMNQSWNDCEFNVEIKYCFTLSKTCPQKIQSINTAAHHIHIKVACDRCPWGRNNPLYYNRALWTFLCPSSSLLPLVIFSIWTKIQYISIMIYTLTIVHIEYAQTDKTRARARVCVRDSNYKNHT